MREGGGCVDPSGTGKTYAYNPRSNGLAEVIVKLENERN